MFRYQLFSTIKNKAEYDRLPPDSDPTDIGPVDYPLIKNFTELLDAPESDVMAVKLDEEFNRVKASAEAGDKLCQEFLAFALTFLDEENKFNVNRRDMAERAFREHSSPIGAYVLFKFLYDEGKLEEAAKHITVAIESGNPDIRLDLALWLDPVNYARAYSKDIKLQNFRKNCEAFDTFCLNHFKTNNPFYPIARNQDSVKVAPIADTQSSDNDLLFAIAVTFCRHFLSKNYVAAWQALEEIIKDNNFQAEAALVALANNNIFWYVENENGCKDDNDNNENTLRDLLEFKATIPAFNTFIQNSPLVSTFINEEHLKRRIALKKYQNAIHAKDFNSAEEHLTVALSDYDLGVVLKFLYTSDFLEAYNSKFPVGANLLKMLAEETNEKTAYFRFWDFFVKKDLTSAANYFASATANSTPEITSFFILGCIVHSVELSDTESSMGLLIDLAMNSSEFHQFIMQYKGYWPHLEQAVLEKIKACDEVNEIEQRTSSLSL